MFDKTPYWVHLLRWVIRPLVMHGGAMPYRNITHRRRLHAKSLLTETEYALLKEAFLGICYNSPDHLNLLVCEGDRS
jgi:hypothetical protein